MDENSNLSGHFNKQKAIRKLTDELFRSNFQTLDGFIEDDEMLSLIVSEVVKGVDIAKRYPAFHHKLLNNANLRSTFLDLLHMLEQTNVPIIAVSNKTTNTDLSFLTRPVSQPVFEMPGQNNWRVVWQRTMAQLQEIFSPSELTYRADPDLLEDPWFTIVKEEVEIEASLCAITLECTLSGDIENALSTYLNFAMTFGSNIPTTHLPIRANLQWGQYNETVLVTAEGRVKFPDISFAFIYDDQSQKIKCDLNLALELSR
jgi:hypothetical protein